MENNTFADLEKDEYKQGGNSKLEIWYDQVRKKPLQEFSIDDICIAIRQEIFLSAIVPAALLYLRQDVHAGWMYDGELIAALDSISANFWTEENQLLRRELRDSLQTSLDKLPDDIKLRAESLIQKVSVGLQA